MSGHTPGPWEADGATTPGGLGRRYHEIFGAGGTAIAHTADRDPDMGSGEDHANALLLAAAPELADALEELFLWITAYERGENKEEAAEITIARVERSRAALRKGGRLP